MIKQLVGAALVAALVGTVVPADAAKVRAIGCRGDDQARAESAVDAMPDGPGRSMARREIARAQEAMLHNDRRGCAMHLDRAARASAGAVDQQGQSPFAGSMAQAPNERPVSTTGQAFGPASSEPKWDWQPLQVAE
jgi:hypothetical protein